MQRSDLSGQRVDGLCSGGVLFDDRFGGVAQLLDLRLQGGDLRQKLGIWFHGLGRDQNHLGFGWGEGFNCTKPVALVLEHFRCCRG